MISDESLREASDPTTPGDRLEVLWQTSFTRAALRGDVAGLRRAILRNPNLPLPMLRQLLIASDKPSSGPAVWYNPAVPLLLVLEPRPEFRQAAARALASKMLGLMRHSLSLDELVAHWWRFARLHPEQARVGETPATIQLARHLASLFGIPWPEARGVL